MTTTESSKPKVRTITLTDRPPVRVREDLWPVIASARRCDNEHECQANHLWHLTVRQHEDGRTLVYGSETAGNGGAFRGYEEARAGELLDAGADVVSAIIRVGTDARCSKAMQDECIGDLPAVDLDARPLSATGDVSMPLDGARRLLRTLDEVAASGHSGIDPRNADSLRAVADELRAVLGARVSA
jgi:hypothetical protein